MDTLVFLWLRSFFMTGILYEIIITNIALLKVSDDEFGRERTKLLQTIRFAIDQRVLL